MYPLTVPNRPQQRQPTDTSHGLTIKPEITREYSKPLQPPNERANENLSGLHCKVCAVVVLLAVSAACNIAFVVGAGVITLHYKTTIELYAHNLTSNDKEEAPFSSDNLGSAAENVRMLLRTARTSAAVFTNDTADLIAAQGEQAEIAAVRERYARFARLMDATEDSMRQLSGPDVVQLFRVAAEAIAATDMEAVNELLRTMGRKETVENMMLIATRGLNDVDAARESSWRLMQGLRQALDVYSRSSAPENQQLYDYEGRRELQPTHDRKPYTHSYAYERAERR
ncbi:hypothetical protein CYMTET_2590 [Cymbomonas tetramitiformis]|uniref:Transmembrane protein n=1 Tax=Cymbomonas tetramitiformis TaxID=36881 RepID=A0AAE0H4R9_9CHLO|nr:hypothetical protein CYMTET_2772 [Cymbomonas tetramitiformis]KAK3289987.1 hypothetical protein CYMTET_2590 [Cymbomonas tetramitiformis]